jgi:hypothetical protein
MNLLLVSSSFVLDKKPYKYTIKIDYGTERAAKDTTISADRQLTALEALQYASIVVTHPVAGYVFVTSIDDIKGEKGVTAWYYKVNNQPAKALAISNILANGDSICWTYSKDVCSPRLIRNASKIMTRHMRFPLQGRISVLCCF